MNLMRRIISLQRGRGFTKGRPFISQKVGRFSRLWIEFTAPAGGDGYQVRLDHRNLRTPLRKMFVVPSQSLALAVAQEWEAQGAFVQPALMHLVGQDSRDWHVWTSRLHLPADCALQYSDR